MRDDRCDLLCLDLERAEELRVRRLPLEAAAARAGKARGFADATRLVLIDALYSGGELCVCDLAWITEKPQNLVSHHLRALRRAGLARSRRDGRIVFYALTEVGARLYSVLGEGQAPALVELP